VALALRPVAHAIEAVGIEARGREKVDLAAAFAAIGVPRIAEVGSLQSPALSGTHGGVHRLAAFLKWSTVELYSAEPPLKKKRTSVAPRPKKRTSPARKPKRRPVSGSKSRKRKPATKQRRGRR